VASLGVLLVAAGCQLRPFMVSELPDDAAGLLREVRLAHTSGRDLLQLGFLREDTYAPPASALAVPEVGPCATWRTALAFRPWATQQWGRTMDGTWGVTWDGSTLISTYDGRAYPPPPGLDRRRLLDLLAWEVNPSGMAAGPGNRLTVLSPAGPVSRLVVDVTDTEGFTLEVDRRTSWVVAVEAWWRHGRVPVRVRADLGDHRDVGEGVVVPHRVTESLKVGGMLLRYRTVRLWGVEATVARTRPVPLAPHGRPARGQP
jgi:hypothetical protein